MAQRTPSPPSLPPVPQNTPFNRRPSTTEDSPMNSNSAPRLNTLLNIFLLQTSLVHAPSAPLHPALTSLISSLQLHPTLETSLHILNADLPSAHFLARHMAAPPAVEGMLLHSILHRIEGDFENARAWARDVGDACEGWVPKKKGEKRLEEEVSKEMGGGFLEFLYGEGDGGGQGDKARGRSLDFIDEVEKFRKESVGDENALEEKAREEMQKIVEWCRGRFGDGRWVDASEAWARPGEEVRRIGEEMVNGEKGWREF